MAAEFKAKLGPANGPHDFRLKSSYSVIIKTLFVQHIILLAAAVFQLLFCIFLPNSYAIVPSAVLLLGYFITSVIHGLAPASPKNPYMQHVVPGRTTAQLPGPSGSFGTEAAAEGVVVFNLGVQWNHPLGFLGPGGKETHERFVAMNEDLMRRRDELGLISINSWKWNGVHAASSAVITYYFRNVESIHRFAHEELHRKAWDWYNAHRFPTMGIYHETFVVPARSYETIYANCVPVGLGRGAVKCAGVKGDAQWLNTLVSADAPALKTQMLRMGRDEQGNPKD